MVKKKTYEAPELKVTKLECEDVILASRVWLKEFDGNSLVKGYIDID